MKSCREILHFQQHLQKMWLEDQVLLIISDVTNLVVSEKERKDFLSDVSHELNTPLTIIQGYVETIKDFEYQDNFVIKAINHIHNRRKNRELAQLFQQQE